MTMTKQKQCSPNFLRPQSFNLVSNFGQQARNGSLLAPRQEKRKRRRISLQGLNAPTNSSFLTLCFSTEM